VSRVITHLENLEKSGNLRVGKVGGKGKVSENVFLHVVISLKGVPRRQPHRRSGLATLPSVGAVP